MSGLARGDRLIIVGAGIIGTSVAYHLAALGHSDVLVLDRGLIGEGSTARATGGIRAQFTSSVNAALVHRSIEKFRRLSDDTGEPFCFRQHGYLFLLSTGEQVKAFTQAVAMQNRLGIPSRVLTPDEVRELHPRLRTDDLTGATYSAADGSGSPMDAVSAYAKAARRLGATICTRTPVLELITAKSGRVRGVRTDDGDLEAELVIVAAGPQSRDLVAQLGVRLEVSPRRRQAFVMEAPPWLHRDLPFTVDMFSGSYLHPETGRAIVGGNDREVPEGTNTTVDWNLLPSLLSALVHRWPDLATARIISGWAGLREMTPDDHPLVGPVPASDGLWVATGFSGHGFMQAPAIGEAVAGRLLTGRSDIDLAPLRMERFAEAQSLVERGIF